MRRRQTEVRDLAGSIVDRQAPLWVLETPPDPLEWIESIDLSNDPSSDADGACVLDYYQVAPILAQFDPEVREVDIMGPEQTGKSFSWRLPVVYRVRWQPSPMWIIYESEEKASEINRETLHPMLMAVPEVANQINRKTAQKDRYLLPNGAIIDFNGAGADITSKAKVYGVADEVDTWPMPNPGKRRNLSNFKKRFRVAFAKGRGCLVKCSSPKGEDSIIADEWDESDRGRWHLRCLKCNGFTIGSHRHDVVQWERDENGDPINETIRVICPKCKREHVEAEAHAMNEKGGYVSEFPARKRHRGFQWGALACPRVFTWLEFAVAAQAGGKSGDIDDQVYFDNSVRGIRYTPRKATRQELDALKLHESESPDDSKICGVLMAADTQDKCWYWTVVGIDTDQNFWIPPGGYGVADTREELEAAWNERYWGFRPVLGIIDEGGHRKEEVSAIVDDNHGLLSWKGNPRIGVNWRRSKDEDTLILGNPHTYRYRMLHRLYRADEVDGYWIGFPADGVSQDFYDQLSFRPNGRVRNGHRLENWVPADDENDHYFDCLKEAECLFEIAKAELPKNLWKIQCDWQKGKEKRQRRRRRRGPGDAQR
jgi:hypothetical protein